MVSTTEYNLVCLYMPSWPSFFLHSNRQQSLLGENLTLILISLTILILLQTNSNQRLWRRVRKFPAGTPEKSNRGGSPDDQKISNFSACKAQDNQHEIRMRQLGLFLFLLKSILKLLPEEVTTRWYLRKPLRILFT